MLNRQGAKGRRSSIYRSSQSSAPARRLRVTAWLGAAATVACTPLAAFAAPATFDGNAAIGNPGDNLTWGDPNNWTTNGVVDTLPSNAAPGDDLTFGNGTPSVIDLQTARFANSLSFTTGYTLGTAATTLTLTNATGNVTVSTGVTGTLNAILAGANGLNLSGGGTLLLSRTNNTFTGNITVDGTVAGTALSFTGTGNADQTSLGTGGKSITLTNGGILRLAASADPSAAGNKSFFIGSGGGTFDVPTGITFTVNDGTNLASTTTGNPAQLQGSGNLTKVGGGTLILGQAVTTSFNGGNFSGNLLITAGRVQAFGTAVGSTPLGTTAGNTQISGTGVLDLQANTAEPIVINGQNTAGSLVVGAGSGVAGSVTINTPVAYVGGTGTLTVGVISDGGAGNGVNKVGVGALVLTAAPTYGGTTTISGGALRLTSTSFTPTNNIQLVGGALETNFSYSPTLGTGAGQVNVGSGTSGFSANGAPVTVNVNGGGTLQFGSANFTPDALLLNQTTANNALTLANGLDLNGATRTVTVAAAVGTNAATVAGAIVNTAGSPAGLTKNGAGVLVLANAANTYDGTTTVAAGVLRANDGTSLPSGNLTLSAGVFETGVNFVRPLGNGANQVQLTGSSGGFSAFGAPVNVDLGGDGTGTGPQLTFGSANFFPGTAVAVLTLNEASANNTLNLRNSLNLAGTGSGTAARTINVNANVATVSGFVTQNAFGTNGVGIVKGGAGTLVLGNPTNNFTGTVVFAGGVVNVANLADYGVPSALGARTLAQETTASNDIIGLRFLGGTLQYTGTTPQSTNRQVRVGIAGATFDASGANTNATVSFTGASGTTINLFDTAGVRTVTLTGSNAGTNTFGIQLTNQGTNATSLTKTGLGTWIVSNTNNTFTGNVTVSSGNLRITNAAALGSTTATRTVSIVPSVNPTSLPGLQLDGSQGNITIPAAFAFNTSYDALSSNVPIPGQGAVVNLAGSNTIAGNFSLASGGGGTTIFANAGTLTLTGTFTPVTTTRILFARGNGNTVFSGVIANGSTTTGMPFTRGTGTGTTTLSAFNTYTGTTTVNSGTLLVNGTGGTPTLPQFNYSVTDADGLGGGVLGGIGTVNLMLNQAVTLTGLPSATGRGNNAVLSPGASAGAVGTFTVAATGAASVNFGANSTYAVDIAPGNTSDRLTLTGAADNLVLAGTTAGPASGASDVLAVTGTSTGTYTIASFGGTRTGVFDFVSVNGIDDPGTFTVGATSTLFTANDNSVTVLYDDANQNVVLTVNGLPTPEPTTLLLVVPATLGLFGRRKRRNSAKQAKQA